jgi:hypothetical protein
MGNDQSAVQNIKCNKQSFRRPSSFAHRSLRSFAVCRSARAQLFENAARVFAGAHEPEATDASTTSLGDFAALKIASNKYKYNFLYKF